MEKNSVVLTVYFCGTDSTIDSGRTQISLFSQNTEAVQISQPHKVPIDAPMLTMSFDGCGTTDGLLGVVFAKGLDYQCRQVVDCIKSIFESDENRQITLNCLGLSRGGMAILMLAKMLGDYDQDKLRMNAIIFDPVPGNLIFSSNCFLYNRLTFAHQCMDVSTSKCLSRVLSIYPYIPLPDVSFHAPLLPKYPTNCSVVEDVTLGCHQGALGHPNRSIDTQLSFNMIYKFLVECGTKLSPVINMYLASDMECLGMMERVLKNTSTSIRYTHSYVPTTINKWSDGVYLNKFHEELVNVEKIQRKSNESKHRYMLSIERQDGSSVS
eukprot:TRINITY_DN6736_c0_g1_i2.p1 TRINITY_DN6736_c0_g1~~TRINITY_DN6736_c0_g1_i2.p1  ORF type:complete len:324 (+),score=5.05 TRINITY_DN6736_c0_g1_i2:935-1906(+)